MRRAPAMILWLFAVVGFVLPSTPVVHAHEDGHDAHGHRVSHVLHVAVHGHEHGPDGEHDHAPATRHDGEDAPEPHVHGGDPLGMLARPRTTAVVPTPADGQALPCLLAGRIAPVAAPCVASAASGARDGATDGGPSRALDRLVDLGRLLI